MTTGPFAGRVFVVAGTGAGFDALTGALVAGEALVAVVSTTDATAGVAAHFRADHGDPELWGRMLPHVEQRLGPIDAVVTDEAGRGAAERLLGPDFRRRGHGDVVVAATDCDVDSVLRTLAGTL